MLHRMMHHKHDFIFYDNVCHGCTSAHFGGVLADGIENENANLCGVASLATRIQAAIAFEKAKPFSDCTATYGVFYDTQTRSHFDIDVECAYCDQNNIFRCGNCMMF